MRMSLPQTDRSIRDMHPADAHGLVAQGLLETALAQPRGGLKEPLVQPLARVARADGILPHAYSPSSARKPSMRANASSSGSPDMSSQWISLSRRNQVI